MNTHLWHQCIRHLEQELSGQDFNTWIRPLSVSEDADRLYLLAPNQFVMDQVAQHFYPHIQQILSRLNGGSLPSVMLRVGSNSNRPPAATQHASECIPTSISEGQLLEEIPIPRKIINTGLNADLTFDTFVQGHANRIARSAAFQVAEWDGYSPLYIYGGVGLGKTHLMHAIGNHMLTAQPDARVAYIHAERFVTDMVKALQKKATTEFKKRYRSLDVLLIDDVQFFGHKIQSQEELFHTFNTLMEENKQLILTCDRPPRQIDGLEDRLKSRFGGGLMVAIDPPDYETRLAILRFKAQRALINLPNDVCSFIARHIQSNVRELEGALHRLTATARFMQQSITLETAQATLQDLLVLQRPVISLASIQKTVSDYFNISLAELRSRRRQRVYARARQIAMTLSKELTQHSLPEIGDAFGGRDHTTVLYSCRAIHKLRRDNPQVQQDYETLLQRLGG